MVIIIIIVIYQNFVQKMFLVHISKLLLKFTKNALIIFKIYLGKKRLYYTVKVFIVFNYFKKC